MATYEFRLAGDGTVLGTKELAMAPAVDEDIAIEGIPYRVDAEPEDVRTEPIVVYVRKAVGI